MNTVKRSFTLILSLIIVLTCFSSCGRSDTPSVSTSTTDSINTTDTINTSTEAASTDLNDTATQAVTEATPKPVETASVPDPDFYLNRAPDSTVDEYRVYCFKGDPTNAAKNYVSVLQDKYVLSLTDTYEDGTTLGWHLQKGSNENADVDISVNCTGGISWELWISFGADVTLTAAETWDEPIVPTLSDPTLPSPDAFFNNRLARNEDFYDEKKGRYTISFKADIDTGALAMEEYVSLLFDEKFKLEKAFETDETILYLKQHNFGFNYVGEKDVECVIDEYKEVQGDLLVYIQRNGKTGTSLMTLHFKPDVYEFIDFGDRTTYSPTDYSGKNTSSGSSNNDGIYDSKQECTDCDGSGKCKTCGGDGYLRSSASDKEDRNCYKCHPNYGKCSSCNGTGYRK